MATMMRFQLQCPPPQTLSQPPRLSLSLSLRVETISCCALTKPGQRFLTKLSTTTTTATTDSLIRKFVQGSPKSVVLSTLIHLLSPTTHPHLSSLALPLYARISEAPWFTWNPTILADLTALLYKQGRYPDAETLISDVASRQHRDVVNFYCKLLKSYSKRGSQTGFDAAYSYLNQLLPSSSVGVNRRAYEHMVSGLCAMDRPREAEDLVRHWRYDDDNVVFQPSAFELKCIMYAYGRLGLFQDLLRILAQMEKGGFVIDTICYNMVLSSFGIHGEHVEMVSWLRRMRNCGVPYSIRTYNSVSNCCPTIMNKMVGGLNDLALSIEELHASLEGGEAMVVKELLACSAILEDVMVWDSSEAKLDLHGFHLGSAYLVMLLWLEEMQTRLFNLNGSNYGVPAQVTVVCGLGKHSSVRGESPVKVLVKEMMTNLRSPLRIDKKNRGCIVAKGKAVKSWLCKLRKA